MNFWPLRSPPQIAGDSISAAIASGAFSAIAIPDTGDGNQAKYVLVSWEGDETLEFRCYAGQQVCLGGLTQPHLLSVAGMDRALQFKTYSATIQVHITPVEV